MKLLIFADYFFPAKRAGGPLKSILNMIVALSDAANVSLVTRDHDVGSAEPFSIEEINKYKSLVPADVRYVDSINVGGIRNILKSKDYSSIILNSFFSKFSIIVYFLRITSVTHTPIIIFPRGELDSVALSTGHSRLKRVFLFLFKFLVSRKKIVFVATSKNEQDNISNLLPGYELRLIPNFAGSRKTIGFKKDRYTELRFVYLARIVRNKNLLIVLKAAQHAGLKLNLDIYGPIEDSEYWSECETIIKQSNADGARIKYCGVLEQHDVKKKLEEYNAFILLTAFENYGHSIVEALEAGLISIIGENTPWVDLEKYEAGWVVDHDDLMKCANTLMEVCSSSVEERFRVANNARRYILSKTNDDKVKKMILELVKCYS